MMKHVLRRLMAAWVAVFFVVGAAAEEIAVSLADFEHPGAAADWSWYWGGGGSITVSESAEQVRSGSRSAKMAYRFAGSDGNFTLRSSAVIPPNPTFLRLWIYGDGSGHSVSLRIIDRTGQTFLYRIVKSIDWVGWRQLTTVVDGYSQKWSGNNDDVIDLPAFLAFQMNGKAAGEGAIYIDDVEVGSWLTDGNRIELTGGAELFSNIGFGSQEVVEVPFLVRDRGGAASSLLFKYSVVDGEGKYADKGEKQVSLAQGDSAAQAVTVPIKAGGAYGYYDITAEIALAGSGKVLQTIKTSAAVVPQPPLVAPVDNPFGMNLSLASRHVPSARAAGAAMARKSGVGWTREEFSWDKVEIEKGKMNWSDYDSSLAVAKKEGLGVLGLIGFSAKWARRDPDKHTSPPRDVQDYADFVFKLVSRYKGQIKHWEIWNEPDSTVFWPPKANAAEYTEMLKAAYAAAKRADPNCEVMTAGLLVGMNHFKQWQYLDEMYTNGAAGSFDIIGWHAYCDPKSPTQGLYEELTQELFNRMKANGDKPKHAWLTEQGWATIKGFARSVTEKQQASYIVQSHVLALSNPSVDKFFWFLFRDGGNRESDYEQSYGILNPDGTPKLAYGAYVAMTARLAGKTPAPPVALPRTAICRVFEDARETVFVLWDAGQDPYALPEGLAREGVALYDARGNALAFEAGRALGADVRYLVVPAARAPPSAPPCDPRRRQ